MARLLSQRATRRGCRDSTGRHASRALAAMFLALPMAVTSQPAIDLLITNARIIDGTGSTIDQGHQLMPNASMPTEREHGKRTQCRATQAAHPGDTDPDRHIGRQPPRAFAPPDS